MTKLQRWTTNERYSKGVWGRRKETEEGVSGYKRILVVMKLFILSVVVVTRIYTCDEIAQNFFQKLEEARNDPPLKALERV